MAYIYVKSGGTATGTAGKYADAKTGSWSTAFTDPSQYYGSISSCLENAGLVDSDTVYISNIHTFTTTLTETLTWSSPVLDLKLISVNDTDLSVSSIGASETIDYSGASSYTFRFSFPYVYGLELKFASRLTISLSYVNFGKNTYFNYVNCTFKSLTSYATGRNFTITEDTIFKNCTFDFSSSTNYKIINNGGSSIFKNCTFIRNTISTSLFGYTSYNETEFDGCDFSQALCPITELTSGYAREHIISRSKESANSRDLPSGLGSMDYYFNKNSIYDFRRYEGGARIECDTSIYRLDGSNFNGSQYFSYKITTDKNLANFKLCEFYSDFSIPRTITVHLARDNNAEILYDNEISLELLYPDLYSAKAHYEYTFDVMKVCIPSLKVGLPGSSRMWNGLTNPRKQQIEISTSKIGGYGMCTLFMRIKYNGVILYVCPQIDIT